MAATAKVEPATGHANPPRPCSPGSHSYAYAHGRPGDVPRDVPLCERPKRMACQNCPEYLVLPCETSSTKSCAACGERYRRRVQTVFVEGSRAGAGLTVVLTLTAPGVRVHRDWTRQGGPTCECTPAGGVDLAEWNGRQGERWNRFMQALRRSGILGDVLEYGRAVEVQQRKALHEHVLIRTDRVTHLTEAVVHDLRVLAVEHGYGHELVVEKAAVSEDGRARLAAWYAAKYVSKATDSRDDVPWRRRDLVLVDGSPRCDRKTGEVLRSPWTYRTWTASRGWGCSMGTVREAQRLWAHLQLRRMASEPPPMAGGDAPPPPGIGDAVEASPD